MGISRRYMLKKNKEFVYLYRRGKTVYSDIMTLVYAPCRADTVKVGFSVSRKVGSSVVRNRLKRLMRENFRLNMPLFKTGCRYVFTARIPMKDADFHQVERAMRQLVKKAGLFNE